MKVKFKMPFLEIETDNIPHLITSLIVSLLLFIIFDIFIFIGLHKAIFLSHILKAIVFSCLMIVQAILVFSPYGKWIKDKYLRYIDRKKLILVRIIEPDGEIGPIVEKRIVKCRRKT